MGRWLVIALILVTAYALAGNSGEKIPEAQVLCSDAYGTGT